MTIHIFPQLNRKGISSFIIAVLLLLSAFSFAQSQAEINKVEKKFIKKADRQWRKAHLAKAMELYKRAFSLNPKNNYTNFQIGAIFYLSDSMKVKALPYFNNTIKYSPLIADDTIIDAYYYMAYCYMLEEKYDSSAICFKKYKVHLENVKSNNPAFTELDRNFKICGMAPGILKRTPDSTAYLISSKPQPTYIKNLGSSVNSSFSEYSQLLYDKDSLLLFTSKRPTSQKGKVDYLTGHYFEDTYISKKDSAGKWSTPSLFSKQLHIAPRKLNMATVSLSDDGNTLYIYKGGNILESGRKNGEWSEPRNLSKDIKKLKKYYIPSIFVSEDGTKLLLVSDKDGGYGERDIYECVKDASGNWSDPKNLGPVINTSEDEDSPYLMPDNKTLFFSSKGHGGLGGYDIFVSHFEDGQWTTPQNLGAPINSPADDIYFTYKDDEKKGYFSSSRISGAGDMDIYSFEFNCNDIPNTNLVGKVLASSQEESILPPIGITIADLTNPQNTLPIAVSVNENGKYSTKLKPEHKYHLEIKCAGYLPYNLDFSTPHQCDPYNLYQAIRLARLDDASSTHIGQNLIVKNAFYQTTVFGNNKNAKSDPDISSLMAANNDTNAIYEKDTTYTVNYTPEERDNLNPKKAEVKNATPEASANASTVYFEFKSSLLDDNFRTYLNSVVAALKENKNMKLSINGYTDDIGKTYFNKRLSVLRANAVAKYLHQQGIKRSRIKIKGFGATQFVAPNDGQHNYLNRRAEVQIIK